MTARPNNIFTPNVAAGRPENGRFVLYKRGIGLYSTTPTGQRFRASFKRDACGLGCECGAVVVSISERGIEAMRHAEIINSVGATIREHT